MDSNELSEKIYYEDDKVKVTNVRITCNHLTAPIEKIGSVNVNYRTEKFAVSIIIMILFASLLLFFPLFPEKLTIPFTVIILVMVLLSATFVAYVYNNYVELIVSVTGHRVNLMNTNMLNKAYLEKVCSHVSEALLDEKKYQTLKNAGELEDSLKLNPSETLQLKMVLEDYKELKKLKDQLAPKEKKDK